MASHRLFGRFAGMRRTADTALPSDASLSEPSMADLPSLITPQIVVVGGIVMDFLFEVPESTWPQPGEAVQGNFTAAPGGKGLNQATACARLGAPTAIISAIGGDGYGRLLTDRLRAHEHVATLLHVVDPLQDTDEGQELTVTDITAVVVASGRPGYIGCRRATNELKAEHIDAAREVILSSDVVLVAFDASVAAIQRVVELASSAHKHIIINAAPPESVPLSILQAVDYVVCSEWEARKWLALTSPTLSEDEIDRMEEDAVAHRLLEAGAQAAILTTGAQGCNLTTEEGHKLFRSFRVRTRDSAGASDAFCAGLAVALASGQQQDDRIRFASAAAALACTKSGAYPSMPTIDDVRRFLESHADERLDFAPVVPLSGLSTSG